MNMPISKCEHSVYIPQGETRAIYCRICTPDGPTNTKDVVLPRSSNDCLDENTRVFANKHSGTGCPACGSHVWCRADEKGSDSSRLCADCGTPYRVRLRAHQRAQELFQEIGL